MTTELEDALNVAIKGKDIEEMVEGELTEGLDMIMNKLIRARNRMKAEGHKVEYLVIKITE